MRAEGSAIIRQITNQWVLTAYKSAFIIFLMYIVFWSEYHNL